MRGLLERDLESLRGQHVAERVRRGGFRVDQQNPQPAAGNHACSTLVVLGNGVLFRRNARRERRGRPVAQRRLRADSILAGPQRHVRARDGVPVAEQFHRAGRLLVRLDHDLDRHVGVRRGLRRCQQFRYAHFRAGERGEWHDGDRHSHAQGSAGQITGGLVSVAEQHDLGDEVVRDRCGGQLQGCRRIAGVGVQPLGRLLRFGRKCSGAIRERKHNGFVAALLLQRGPDEFLRFLACCTVDATADIGGKHDEPLLARASVRDAGKGQDHQRHDHGPTDKAGNAPPDGPAGRTADREICDHGQDGQADQAQRMLEFESGKQGRHVDFRTSTVSGRSKISLAQKPGFFEKPGFFSPENF